MTNKAKYFILFAVGMIFCIVPSVLTVGTYFPIWKEAHPSVMASGVLVSGLSLALMAAVALPPVAKWLKMIVGKTPSAWVGFGIAAILFKLMEAVIDSMFVIFFVAALSNLCGQIFFWWANRHKRLWRREEGLRDE